MPTHFSSFLPSTLKMSLSSSKASSQAQSKTGTVSKTTPVSPFSDPKKVRQTATPYGGVRVDLGKQTLLLGKIVGSGSFGVVRMAAEQRGSEVRLYAVKAIRDFPEAGETTLFEAGQTNHARGQSYRHAMARQEIDILQKAHSPLAPKYFFADEGNTTSFIVMPLMTGTLEELMTGLPKQPGVERNALAAHALPLIEALGDLHKRGIAHMDIKPANIFVGQDLKLVLGDFGIATRAERCQGARGTPIWMAPEVFFQLDGVQQESSLGLGHVAEATFGPTAYLSQPTDLYSVGLTLFSILTGRNPVNYWDWNNKAVSYTTGMRAIWDMHTELHKAERKLTDWRDGKALPSFMTNPLNLKPASRQIQSFFQQLSKVDREQLAVSAAIALISPKPVDRLEAPGYKTPLAIQESSPTVEMLASKMPSAVNKALQDCPLLGVEALQQIQRGERGLFDIVAPQPTVVQQQQNATVASLLSEATARPTTRGRISTIKALFTANQTTKMANDEVKETLMSEMVMM